ncbi:Spy/CpxP family protein refolding chaperone [Colwelliaceae bacterium MEBiC 14330]
MNYSLKNFVMTTSLCSALVLSTISYAGSENTPDNFAVNEKNYQAITAKKLAKLSRKLELTDKQQADIKTLKRAEQDELEKFKPAMKAFRQQVKTLMSAENFDEQAFIALQAGNQDIFNQVALIKAKNKFAMKGVLTPEQFEQFNAMKFKRLRR